MIAHRIPTFIATLVILLTTLHSLSAQTVRVKRLPEDSGTVLSKSKGQITLRDSGGAQRTYKIQTSPDDPVMLGGARINLPAKVSVRGDLPVEALRTGAFVVFEATAAKAGRPDPISKMKWIVDNPPTPTFKPKGEAFEVAGKIEKIQDRRLTLTVPRSKLALRGKLFIGCTEDATVSVDSTTLSLVQAGDEVESFSAVKSEGGDFAIESLTIRLNRTAETRTTSIDDQLAEKYADKSDEPVAPREVRSQHFLLQTDISDRQAAILLDKLETMLTLVSRYYSRPPTDIIRCFVVRDMNGWEGIEMEPAGVAKIQSGEGVTLSRSLGRQRQSRVYSCDKHETVQHEAVHAYCYQTFGSTGPTWYSEGMAEMGAYWQEGQKEVSIRPAVIDYLTSAPPKKMLDIVAAGQVTGDSWQAYAWRWALCHLLASNPNYAQRFNVLGPAMMAKQPNATFESTFGDIAQEISFEYDQFVENFGNGYRADLCAWQWAKAKPLAPKKAVKLKVVAAAGWQAAKVAVSAGQAYQYGTQGEWKIGAANAATSAEGQSDGRGRLIAAVLTSQLELSEPIELGVKGAFTPTESGNLYLRCRDDWTQIGDNTGEMTVGLRLPKSQ